MRSRLAGTVAVVLAIMLAAAACGGGGTEGPAGGSPQPTEEGGTITIGGQQANDHGSQDVSGRDEIEVEADDFYFEPTVLQGSPGQALKIEVHNEGQALHNFSLTEQGIDMDVASGEDISVDVSFPDSGTLVFFCKYHRTQGMVGGLSV